MRVTDNSWYINGNGEVGCFVQHNNCFVQHNNHVAFCTINDPDDGETAYSMNWYTTTPGVPDGFIKIKTLRIVVDKECFVTNVSIQK